MKIYKKVSSRIFSTTNIKHNIFRKIENKEIINDESCQFPNKNRRRNTVIARGKIINIEHNEDYSYLKLFIRNGAGLRHTYLIFRYDPKIFYISKNQYVIITAHIENKQNSFGGVDQFIIIDSISESQSELSEHFLIIKRN